MHAMVVVADPKLLQNIVLVLAVCVCVAEKGQMKMKCEKRVAVVAVQ